MLNELLNFTLQTQYRYSDGGLSDTGVLVDLINTDGSKVRLHRNIQFRLFTGFVVI